jgi:hypothetical protein
MSIRSTMGANMGSMGSVKATVEIQDALFKRAKAKAKKRGVPFRVLVEEGLRQVVEAPEKKPYVWKDCSVGKAGGPNPLDEFTWAEILEIANTR